MSAAGDRARQLLRAERLLSARADRVQRAAKKRAAPRRGLLFWRAFGMLQEGALNEAIKELQAVEARGDAHLSLPVKLALPMHAHQQARAIDEEEIARLRGEVDLEEQNAPERAAHDKRAAAVAPGRRAAGEDARARLLSLQPQSVPALTLVGHARAR